MMTISNQKYGNSINILNFLSSLDKDNILKCIQDISEPTEREKDLLRKRQVNCSTPVAVTLP